MKQRQRIGIKELLNIDKNINENIKNSSPPETTASFDIVKLSVYDLEPHPDNKYSVDDILDLKDSIELMGGIEQNLIVKKNETGNKYTVIAGHRRRLAALALVEEGKKQFELVPCRIKTNLDSITERILLIHTNSTNRVLSDWEKTEQLRELKNLLIEYKKERALPPGRMQKLLAETLNVSESQVGRYERIDKNLTDEYKEEFKKGNVNFSTAAELARLTPEEQKTVYEQHQQSGSTKLKDVKKVKQEKEKEILQPSELTITAAKKILKMLENKLLAELDREEAIKTESAEKAEANESIRILKLLMQTVNKEMFSCMGRNMLESEESGIMEGEE